MLRFALFGAGRAGRIHGRNIAAHPRAELVFVYDVNREAAERLCGEYGGQVAAGPEAIWSSDETDAVLIASSTDTHVELLRGAIGSHKPTYCEKPIDQDIVRAREIEREAAAAALPVLVGFRRRYVPEYQTVRNSLRDGELGRVEVIHMISRDHRPPSLEYIDVSGGLLRDKTIHYFDLVRWLTGEEPVEVFATGSCLVDPRIGEAGDVDTAMVVLRMPGGTLCNIENSRRAVYGFDERIEVFGERGMLQASPDRTSQLAHYSAAGIRLGRFDDYYEESFAATLNAFIRDVEAGAPLQPDLADGLRAQLIAEAAVESLATNRPVPLPD